MLPLAFSDAPEGLFLTEYTIRTRAKTLAGIEPKHYDCCVKSCVCYVGIYASLDTCPECKEPRFSGVDFQGKPHPRRQFTYIPFTQRLCDYLANESMAQSMQYRANHTHHPGTYTDIFDGKEYQTLCNTQITVNGIFLNSGDKYFGDPRDVALGLSTDGFGIFSRGQATCWPLILFNYNLPPKIRFHIDNIIPIGIIPGPNKPAIPDSFLVPLVEELFQLSRGVQAYDVLTKSHFCFHAFLLVVFGDIPAISMLMKMKGVNGICPCRACSIKATPIPGEKNHTHYVPLSTNLTGLNRSHEELMKQAKEVDQAPTKTAADELARQYGIKGTAILSFLDTISLPISFPADFMHIAWENVIKTLVAHWTGEFKGLGQGVECYELGKAWKTIGAIGASSGPTIPSVYGPRIPDVSQKSSYMTADMWSFWTRFLAPVLLRKSFKKPEYFEHFVDLVELFNICLQFKISHAEIEKLHMGFQEWVEGYKKLAILYDCTCLVDTKFTSCRIYYQDNEKRLPAGTLPIHTLLHLADYIEAWGPVWCYWSFPMERFCGFLKHGVKSMRHPYASMDQYLLDWVRLWHLGTIYNIKDMLQLKQPKKKSDGFSFQGCKFSTTISHSSYQPFI